MRLALPGWSHPELGGSLAGWHRFTTAAVPSSYGSMRESEAELAAETAWDQLGGIDWCLLEVLAPPQASPGVVVGQVVEWTERLTPDTTRLASADLRQALRGQEAVSAVTTGLDEALVVRRERQLQAVIPERGTGRALVLTWTAFGDVGWDVHERAFAEAVASASSSATVDLAAR